MKLLKSVFEESESNVRIVTWNCARGPLQKKLDALHRLKPDVAVLCEAPTPEKQSNQVAWFPAEASRLGVQVRTYEGFTVQTLPPADQPACVNPVRIVGMTSFNLLAVWTWRAPSYIRAIVNGIDAYEAILASGPSVVAGDFNGNPKYDKPRQQLKWRDAFQRLGRLSLVSAYHSANQVEMGNEPVPTHRFLRDTERPFHIDFCFVPAAWANDGLKARVEAGSPWDDLSDHRPVVVDIPDVNCLQGP